MARHAQYRFMVFLLLLTAAALWPEVVCGQDGSDMEVPQILAAMRSSISQIRTVQCTVRAYAKQGAVQGGEVSAKGTLLYEYRHACDVAADSIFIDGKVFLTFKDESGQEVSRYDREKAAYNGKELRTYSFDDKSGAISEKEHFFDTRYLPMRLWLHGLAAR